MHLIHLTVSPTSTFDVPYSDGYQLYSSLLTIMKESDPEISDHVHNTSLPSVSIRGLSGKFGKSIQKGHKQVIKGVEYEITIGVSDIQDETVFSTLITPILLNRRSIQLAEGSLSIHQIESTYKSFPDIMDLVSSFSHPVIDMDFLSPTCIQYRNSKVTEMFPQRIAVFYSILSKWKYVCPEKLVLGLERDDFGRYLIEQPDPQRYNTHSVLVNTVYDTKKFHARPIFKQGFTGRCRYSFTSNAPAAIKNACIALAQFAEFCGVGSSVSRGCGQVKVSIKEETHAN
jgi:CRISPR-associated endoribonuclease Cas6